MLPTTVKKKKEKKVQRHENKLTFQLIQYLSKNTQKPRLPDAIQCQPNQGVQPVEHSQSSNDSSASHSVNYSGKSESTQGVQPASFTLCCCMHHQELTAQQLDHMHNLRATKPPCMAPHLIVLLLTADSSIPWTVVYTVQLWLRACRCDRRKTGLMCTEQTKPNRKEGSTNTRLVCTVQCP